MLDWYPWHQPEREYALCQDCGDSVHLQGRLYRTVASTKSETSGRFSSRVAINSSVLAGLGSVHAKGVPGRAD